MIHKRLSQEEIEMRALVLSESATCLAAAARLTDMGYHVEHNALWLWAKDHPKYVPPSTLERLRVRPARKCPPGVVAKPAPAPERQPGPVRTVEPQQAVTAEAIVEAFVAKVTGLKSEVAALKTQVADKNAEIAGLQRVQADLVRQTQELQRMWHNDVEALQTELAARPDGVLGVSKLVDALV